MSNDALLNLFSGSKQRIMQDAFVRYRKQIKYSDWTTHKFPITKRTTLRSNLFQKFYSSWMRYPSALEQFAGISTIQIITITTYLLTMSTLETEILEKYLLELEISRQKFLIHFKSWRLYILTSVIFLYFFYFFSIMLTVNVSIIIRLILSRRIRVTTNGASDRPLSGLTATLLTVCFGFMILTTPYGAYFIAVRSTPYKVRYP